jgi:hypothetical protein
MEARRLTPAARVGAVCAALLASAFFFPPRLHGPVNPQDDGIWLAAAEAAAEGKTLYRDIAYHFGPVLYAPLRALFLFRAPTLSGARAVFWAENVVGLAAVLLLLWAWVRRPAVLAPFLVFLGLVPFAAHTLTIPFAARYGAGFVPLLLWPRSPAEGGRPFLTGLLSGAAYFASQEVGMAAVMAGAFLFWRRGGIDGPARRYALGVLAALAAGLLILVFAADVRFYASSSVFDIGRLVLRIRRPFPEWKLHLWIRAIRGDAEWMAAWLNTATAAAARVPVPFYLLSLWPAFRRRLGVHEERGAGLAVYGLVAAVSAWLRSDRWHAFFSLSPALVLLALWAERWSEDPSRRGQLSFLASLLSGALLVFPTFAAARARDKFFHPYLESPGLPRAGSALLPEGQAAGYRLLAAEVERRVPPGATFFYYPFNGAAYFMTGRPNPCRWPLPVDALRPSQQDEMIRELEASGVRWVVKDEDENAFDGVLVSELLPRLDAYLHDNFVPRDRQGPFLFLEKAPKDPARQRP